jgi:hypothetical protein
MTFISPPPVSIAIDIDERFVHGVGPEFRGVRRRQRVDVQDQDGSVWVIGLLERIVVGDVHPRIHRGRCQPWGIEMVCHTLPFIQPAALPCWLQLRLRSQACGYLKDRERDPRRTVISAPVGPPL